MRDAYVESLEEMHKDVEKLICALKDTAVSYTHLTLPTILLV